MGASVYICLEVHQPLRLKKFRVFDIGLGVDLVDDYMSRNVFLRAGYSSYLPLNKELLREFERNPNLRLAISISGIAIEQMVIYAPEILSSFQELAKSSRVEFLAQTYYGSDIDFRHGDFKSQVLSQMNIVEKYFGIRPTRLAYLRLSSPEIFQEIEKLGLLGIFYTGLDREDFGLFSYRDFSLIIPNSSLSLDLSHRAFDSSWEHFPLCFKKYAGWVSSVSSQVIFLPYEVFGDHASSSPNDFLNVLRAFHDMGVDFLDLNEIEKESFKSVDEGFFSYNKPVFCELQEDAILNYESLYEDVSRYDLSGELILDWRRLGSFEHFAYMHPDTSTRLRGSRAVHSHESRYDSYLSYMNALSDIRFRCNILRGREEDSMRSLQIRENIGSGGRI